MRLSSPVARTFAVLAAVALTWAPVAGASAEPGHGAKGNSGDHSHAKGKSQSSKSKKGAPADASQKDGSKGRRGKENKGSQQKGPGKSSHGKGSHGKQHGDSAGNNGTVKIAPLGEMDRIPNNSPHPGCTFQVEWYGFDEGPDVVSTVTFAMHAPTRDVALEVDGKTSVFVGGDPASGAGTESGLDGREAYTLSFDGEPHPRQGYHVKLTVSTPRSKGNDTKTKVFWVEPCDDAGTGGGATTGDEDEKESGAGQSGRVSSAGSSDDDSDGSADGNEVFTGGETSASVAAAPADSSDDAAQVPTAVDAGEGGQSALDWARSPAGLLIVGAGALLAAGGFLMRRRNGLGSDA